MNIVILDAATLGDDIDLSIFNRLGEVTTYDFTSKEEVASRIEDAHVIIHNKVELTSRVLSHAKNLALICITATGFNNVDLAYAKDHNIAVTNVKNYATNSVAQHTFAILFYLLEKLYYYDNYTSNGNYINDAMFTHFSKKFTELHGKTFGIVGLGNIGKKVANIATAFGAHVIYYSTSGQHHTSTYPSVSFDELLKQSDFVSIHAPLNEKTHHLFTYEKMLQMKPSAYLLNLGRGPIIDENGLAKILKEDRLAGIALDVLEEEPMSKTSALIPYLHHPKLLLTPHIGWASVEARNACLQEVYLNIEAFYQGIPRNLV